MNTYTAVLLTGGESRRMGADKATLLIQNEPLWSWQLRTLQALSPEKIFVSARTRPAWCPTEIETVLDDPPSRGPLSGLVAALKKMQTTHLLALAVDLPRMTAVHLARLQAQAQPGCGVFPRNDDDLEPLCAIYPAEAAAIAAEALAAGQHSAQALARTLCEQGLARVHPLKPAEKLFHHNANTPADWRR